MRYLYGVLVLFFLLLSAPSFSRADEWSFDANKPTVSISATCNNSRSGSQAMANNGVCNGESVTITVKCNDVVEPYSSGCYYQDSVSDPTFNDTGASVSRFYCTFTEALNDQCSDDPPAWSYDFAQRFLGSNITITTRARDGAENISAPASLTFKFVPTCPVPTLSTPLDGVCINTNPTLVSSYNSPGGRQQFVVDSTNPFQGPWVCNSGWLPPQWYTAGTIRWNEYSCSPSTGTYYWSTRTDGGPGGGNDLTCSPASDFATVRRVDVDKDLPATPVTPAATYNAAAKNITFTWPASTDTGCATCGGYASKYWLQGYWSDGSWYVNEGNAAANPSCSATQTYGPISCPGNDGKTAYLNVRSAKDSLNNESTYNTLLGSIACPTPTRYPTIVITGAFQEDTGTTTSTCSSMSPNVSSLSYGITPAAAPGVTVTCPTPVAGATSYSCSLTFDNQGTPNVTPAQTLTFAGTYASYGVSWRNPNACTGTDTNTISIDVSQPTPTVTFNKDIFLKYSNPNWFKLSSSTFDSVTGRNNVIPYNMAQYDATDDTTDKYLDVKKAGTMLSTGDIVKGPHSTLYSTPNWYKASYSLSTVNASSFLQYVQSRKDYKKITSLSEVEDGKVHIYTGGSLAIGDTTPFNSKKVVVLVTTDATMTALGTVSVTTPQFNPASAATAVIAASISFDAAVTEANGIFIANSVSIGTTTNQGLKVKGNLISGSSVSNNRQWSSNTRPSLFVVFDAVQYMNVLPYLSVSTYDWRQLQ